MRRHLPLIGLTCALLVSGWNGALAAALCPHTEGAADEAASVSNPPTDDAHACCRLSGKSKSGDGEDAHCPDAARKEENHSSRPNGASPHHQAAPLQQADRHVEGHKTAPNKHHHHAAGNSTAELSSSCGHCVRRPQQPPAFAPARTAGKAKHGVAAPAARVEGRWHPVVSLLTLSAPVARGAPPGGGGARRHVLISLFLIQHLSPSPSAGCRSKPHSRVSTKFHLEFIRRRAHPSASGRSRQLSTLYREVKSWVEIRSVKGGAA